MNPDETPAVRYGRKLRRKAQAAQACQWFALCDNDATTTQAHPILGDVRICDRCKAKYDRLGGAK